MRHRVNLYNSFHVSLVWSKYFSSYPQKVREQTKLSRWKIKESETCHCFSPWIIASYKFEKYVFAFPNTMPNLNERNKKSECYKPSAKLIRFYQSKWGRFRKRTRHPEISDNNTPNSPNEDHRYKFAYNVHVLKGIRLRIFSECGKSENVCGLKKPENFFTATKTQIWYKM